jgi:hypothetical protein
MYRVDLGSWHIQRRVATPHRGMRQRTGQERFSGTGWTGNQQVVVGGDPAGLSQAEHDRAIESSRRPEVEIFHSAA